jgi:hypothetical protein
MTLNRIGGGLFKGGVKVPCVPSAALKATLDARVAANLSLTGLLVKITWGANNEVAQAATGELFDGFIEYAQPDNIYGYLLDVKMQHFTDKNGVRRACHDVGEYAYTGSPALQDAVVSDTTADMTVQVGVSYGDGAIFSIDTTDGEVVVLME